MLQAISPIDGRYEDKTKELSAYFSEYALIRYRVVVEIQYFIALTQHDIPQLIAFDQDQVDTLNNIFEHFDMTYAESVKIIEKTNGRPARLMNDVTISYKAELLDGKFCYSSDSSGVLSFTLGQSTQPSGLQEGLLKMKEGERAIMIVPSFLAYGITGDAICIPGSSSIVYQLKLEKVSAL